MKHPLKFKQLEKRYKPVFDEISTGRSVSFIGLPLSAKSGYLQYIFRNELFLKESIPNYPLKHKVLYFEPVPIKADNFFLHQLASAIENIDFGYTKPKENDSNTIFNSLLSYISKLGKEKKKLTLFISLHNVQHLLTAEDGQQLRALWEPYRNPPNNPLNFVFMSHSQTPGIDPIPEFYQAVIEPMTESIYYFPTLDIEDSTYSAKRYAKLVDVKLSEEQIQEIVKGAGGYYPLITRAVKTLKGQEASIVTNSDLSDSPYIIDAINALKSSLTEQQRIQLRSAAQGRGGHDSTLNNLGIIKKGIVESTWIQDYYRDKPKSKIQAREEYLLKGNELRVFRELLIKEEGVVSRDEIALILWAEEASEKYSDWAIDKLISRIRGKLKDGNSEYIIVTVKGSGYSMFKR